MRRLRHKHLNLRWLIERLFHRNLGLVHTRTSLTCCSYYVIKLSRYYSYFIGTSALCTPEYHVMHSVALHINWEHVYCAAPNYSSLLIFECSEAPLIIQMVGRIFRFSPPFLLVCIAHWCNPIGNSNDSIECKANSVSTYLILEELQCTVRPRYI